jgi:hypothetical protein
MDGWFDSPIESFKAAYNDGVTKWREALAAFDIAYAEFMDNQAYAQTDDALSGKWGDLSGKVSLLQSTIEGVESAIASIVNFFGGIGQTMGLSGRQTMQGLGVLPAIPWALVALVTAGIAGVWALTNEMRGFNIDVANSKIAEENIRRSQNNEPPLPFIDLGGPSGGLFAGVSSTAKWVAIGVLGYLALNMVEKRRQ